MLKVEDIHTYYGHSYVLQGIDLETGPEHVIAILGRNGMGKTTLMGSIIGFNHPRRGKITYNGEEITNSKPYRIARIGISLVPQGRQIFPSLTVEENLRVAFSGGGDGWNFEKIYELVDREVAGFSSGSPDTQYRLSPDVFQRYLRLLQDICLMGEGIEEFDQILTLIDGDQGPLEDRISKIVIALNRIFLNFNIAMNFCREVVSYNGRIIINMPDLTLSHV